MAETMKAAFEKASQNNIWMNSDMREKYGPLLDQLSPDLKTYDSVLILSRKEVSLLQKALYEPLSKLPSEMERDVTAALKLLYPGVPPERMAGSQSMMDAISDIIKDQSSDRLEAATYSSISGGTERPLRMGFIVLPDRLDFGPEYLAPNVPARFNRYQPAKPGDQEQRQRDNGYMTITHEVGHLVHALQTDRYHMTNIVHESRMTSMEPPDTVERELFAERYSFGKVPELVNSGLIKPSSIIQDRTDARMVMGFHYLMANAFRCADMDGVGIAPHSIGFDIHSNLDGHQIYAKLDSDYVTLREFRNQEYRKMFEDAEAGKASPSIMAAYETIKKKMADNDPISGYQHLHLRRQGASEQDIQFYTFGQELSKDAQMIYNLAQKMKTAPGISAEGQEINRRYLEAADRLMNFNNSGPQNPAIMPSVAPNKNAALAF